MHPIRVSFATTYGVVYDNSLNYFCYETINMKHISVIVPRGDSIVDTIIAPYNLLKMAINHHQKVNRLPSPTYSIDMVGLNNDIINYQGLFSIKPTKTIEEIERTDLIIVSPISGDLIDGIHQNKAFIEWMRYQRITHNAQLASLCKGAFLLAETGLLTGKNCATHWTAHDLFRMRYPDIKLMPEKVVCEDNGIYSSGGAYSILNFTVYLIERLFGRETAIWCSKIAEIDFDRMNQNEFIIFSGQKDHADLQIKEAQDYIEAHYDQKISIADLSNMVHLNLRSFLRRFKKATANTPLEYIQRVKIEAAKRKLETTTNTILQVMYDIGYNDEKAFRKTFRKYSGMTPAAYRLKFNREMAQAH